MFLSPDPHCLRVPIPRGRLLHGRHFTYKSITGDMAITFVSTGVEGAFATEEHPYAAHGPWLQVRSALFPFLFFLLGSPPAAYPPSEGSSLWHPSWAGSCLLGSEPELCVWLWRMGAAAVFTAPGHFLTFFHPLMQVSLMTVEIQVQGVETTHTLENQDTGRTLEGEQCVDATLYGLYSDYMETSPEFIGVN